MNSGDRTPASSSDTGPAAAAKEFASADGAQVGGDLHADEVGGDLHRCRNSGSSRSK